MTCFPAAVGAGPDAARGPGEATRRVLVVALLLWVAAVAPTLADGESSTAPEYKVKAAFLYNFTKFIDWPEIVDESGVPGLVIRVIGEDPFAGILEESFAGKKIGGRPARILHFERPEELQPCSFLFIGASATVDLPDILAATEGTGTVTVADTSGSAAEGMMINFFLTRMKVRFEVNISAAKREGVRISSKLLKLARIVEEDPDPGPHRPPL